MLSYFILSLLYTSTSGYISIQLTRKIAKVKLSGYYLRDSNGNSFMITHNMDIYSSIPQYQGRVTLVILPLPY